MPAACDVAAEEHPHRTVTVGEQREEGRAERCGRQLQDRDEARLVRASPFVGVHQHGDPDRPLGGIEAGVRQLHAPQVAVPEYGAEDTDIAHAGSLPARQHARQVGTP